MIKSCEFEFDCDCRFLVNFDYYPEAAPTRDEPYQPEEYEINFVCFKTQGLWIPVNEDKLDTIIEELEIMDRCKAHIDKLKRMAEDEKI